MYEIPRRAQVQRKKFILQHKIQKLRNIENNILKKLMCRILVLHVTIEILTTKIKKMLE